MSEAIEIGISLALGDGVMQSVAAVKHDMQAVETALAAGAVSVGRLREAAAPALDVPRAGAAKRAEQAPITPLLPNAPQEATPGHRYRARDLAVGSSALAAPAVPPASTAPAKIPAPIERAETTIARAAAAPESLPAQDLREDAPQAPVVTILRMDAEGDAMAHSPPAPREHANRDEFGAAGPRQFRSAFPDATEASPPVFLTPRQGARPGHPAEPNSHVFSDSPFPATASAPSVYGQGLGAADASSGAEGAPARLEAAAPAGAMRERLTMEGDVFLDGALVGRWMSSHLAREAGRALSGPTGFDVRRDPLMPGATVGM